MNEFSKLNRDEMRKITGGVPPVCLVDNTCSMVDTSLPGTELGPLLFGDCRETLWGECQCVRTKANGDLMYGPTWYCMEIS